MQPTGQQVVQLPSYPNIQQYQPVQASEHNQQRENNANGDSGQLYYGHQVDLIREDVVTAVQQAAEVEKNNNAEMEKKTKLLTKVAVVVILISLVLIFTSVAFLPAAAGIALAAIGGIGFITAACTPIFYWGIALRPQYQYKKLNNLLLNHEKRREYADFLQQQKNISKVEVETLIKFLPQFEQHKGP